MREVPAVGIGVLGCGVISKAYLQALRSFPERALRAVADLRPDVAAARAAWGRWPGSW
jgi:predicted dehydrogenase